MNWLVVHACNPGGGKRLRHSLSSALHQVQGQPGLSKIFPQGKKKSYDHKHFAKLRIYIFFYGYILCPGSCVFTVAAAMGIHFTPASILQHYQMSSSEEQASSSASSRVCDVSDTITQCEFCYTANK